MDPTSHTIRTRMCIGMGIYILAGFMADDFVDIGIE